jgi:hypothetical protein
MQRETVTQEAVLEKVRHRLGALDVKAEQAVAEAIAIVNESRKRETPPQSDEEQFVSANVSVAQYKAWSPEERFQYLNNAEKVNAHWIERQLQKLNAAWLMVIDGQVVAHDADVDNLPRAQEFNVLCQKYAGKYPFVFFNPRLFMIEETKEAELVTFCIKHWHASPFVAINPNRAALIGRKLFHKITPIVHLDFATCRTEIEFPISGT